MISPVSSLLFLWLIYSFSLQIFTRHDCVPGSGWSVEDGEQGLWSATFCWVAREPVCLGALYHTERLGRTQEGGGQPSTPAALTPAPGDPRGTYPVCRGPNVRPSWAPHVPKPSVAMLPLLPRTRIPKQRRVAFYSSAYKVSPVKETLRSTSSSIAKPCLRKTLGMLL